MIQVAYLRRIVQALDRLTGGRASGELRSKLQGDALSLYLSPELQSGAPTSRVSSESAGTLLLAMDAALGDGSGALLNQVGQELGNRFFATPARGRLDVWTSMRQVSNELTASFSGGAVQCRADRHAEGLELFISVPGQPRATRALRYLAIGYLRAAFTFAFEATSIQLRVVGETVGDRASVTARYRQLSNAEPLTPPPPSSVRSPKSASPAGRSQRSLPSMRAVSVADEVDRILRHAPRDGRPKVPKSG